MLTPLIGNPLCDFISYYWYSYYKLHVHYYDAHFLMAAGSTDEITINNVMCGEISSLFYHSSMSYF